MKKMMKYIRTFCLENAIVGGFIFVYAVALTIQNVCNPISDRVIYSDGAIYQYIGHLILQGKMPYLDVFDHKGPLLYLLNAVGCLVSIKWGIWLIDTLFMVAIMMVSYKIARRFLGKAWSVLICAILYSDFSEGYWIGNTPDYYAVLFVAVAFYWLLDYYSKQELDKKGTFIAGLCCSCAFWLKQTAIVSILILCFFILLDCYRRKKFRDIGKYMAQFSAAFLISSIPVCMWIYINHAWDAMIRDYFWFNFVYTSDRVTAARRVDEFMYLSSYTCVVAVWILFACFLLGKIENNKPGYDDKIIIHGMMTLIMTLVLLSIPGRKYGHYLLILYPVLVTITAPLLRSFQVMEVEYKRLIEAVALIAAICLIVCPNLSNIKDYCASYWNCIQEDVVIMEDIESYCVKGDTIAVASPGSCGYYLKTGFESATTYPYIQADTYGDETFKKAYNTQIKSAVPKVIVWCTNWSAEIFFDEDVLVNYDAVNETNNFRVYVLRNFT